MADLRFQPVKASTAVIFDTYQDDILRSLQADLNTPRALAFLHEGRQGSIPNLLSRGVAHDNLAEFKQFLTFLDRVFGLELLASKDITDDQKVLIAKREAARAEKDFAKADHAREALQQQGIYLRDTPNGPLWYR
jgi:cysteinyl-tRNA synthetase